MHICQRELCFANIRMNNLDKNHEIYNIYDNICQTVELAIYNLSYFMVIIYDLIHSNSCPQKQMLVGWGEERGVAIMIIPKRTSNKAMFCTELYFQLILLKTIKIDL